MLEYYYSDPKCIEEKRRNYLASYLHDIADLFHREERSQSQAHFTIRSASLFGDWLQGKIGVSMMPIPKMVIFSWLGVFRMLMLPNRSNLGRNLLWRAFRSIVFCG